MTHRLDVSLSNCTGPMRRPGDGRPSDDRQGDIRQGEGRSTPWGWKDQEDDVDGGDEGLITE